MTTSYELNQKMRENVLEAARRIASQIEELVSFITITNGDEVSLYNHKLALKRLEDSYWLMNRGTDENTCEVIDDEAFNAGLAAWLEIAFYALDDLGFEYVDSEHPEG